MIFGSLRKRLLLTNVAVMAAILVVIGGGILLVMDRLLIAQETATVNSDLQRAVIERRELSQDEFQSRHTFFTSGTFFVIWDNSGAVTFNPSGAPTAPLRAAAVSALGGRGATVRVDLQANEPALIASQVITDQGGTTGVMQAGRSLVPVLSVEREALLVMLGAGLASLLVIVLAGWFLTERALVPIRLAMDRQARFTADASHELRTPLAIVDAGLQVLSRHPDQTIAGNAQLLDSMSAETQRMARLVDDLLTLARVDVGSQLLRLEPTDISQLIVSTGADLQALATSRGGHLDVQSEPRIDAIVDRDRIRQLVVILVDNALRHGAPGGTVEVRSDRIGHELRLEVSDRGPGIPAEHRGKVFEPFFQLDGSRAVRGSGLGLTIGRWIAAAHGGTIKLTDNEPGLVVRVLLPLRGLKEDAGRPPARLVTSAKSAIRGPDPSSTG
ncbi:MAG TPA: HAMP domain-containing sensor histidine kinase [Candidatus Acidoferrum sp.]|jgi:two-component system sensor histidine kinase CiaH|nr:HAMP domain-containing sensor histidine kinase [Candidatus Acidoferrum sp.]